MNLKGVTVCKEHTHLLHSVFTEVQQRRFRYHFLPTDTFCADLCVQNKFPLPLEGFVLFSSCHINIVFRTLTYKSAGLYLVCLPFQELGTSLAK